MSVLAAAAGPIALTLFAGCVNLAEESLDTVVYFDNRTNQTIYLSVKGELATKDGYFQMAPLRITQLRLVGRGKCTERVVITNLDGKIVKDPGKVCWHDTVTIP